MKRSLLSNILIPTLAIVLVGGLMLSGFALSLFRGPQAGAEFVTKYLTVAAKPATDRLGVFLKAITDIPSSINQSRSTTP